MALGKSIVTSMAVFITTSATLTALPAQADETGAFIGGVMAARIGSNMRARTQAEQEQAYYAQQQSQQVQQVQQAPAAPPASSTQSVEQKLNELNKLAAGGYITPEEYKAQKQQILNSI